MIFAIRMVGDETIEKLSYALRGLGFDSRIEYERFAWCERTKLTHPASGFTLDVEDAWPTRRFEDHPVAIFGKALFDHLLADERFVRDELLDPHVVALR